MSTFDIAGARLDELLEIVNAVVKARWGHGDFKVSGKSVSFEHDLAAGMVIKVRMDYGHLPLVNGERMSFTSTPGRVTVNGQGWMIMFDTAYRRSEKLPAAVKGEKVKLETLLARQDVYIHSLRVISPEEFRTQMTLLRLFESEWAQAA